MWTGKRNRTRSPCGCNTGDCCLWDDCGARTSPWPSCWKTPAASCTCCGGGHSTVGGLILGAVRFDERGHLTPGFVQHVVFHLLERTAFRRLRFDVGHGNGLDFPQERGDVRFAHVAELAGGGALNERLQVRYTAHGYFPILLQQLFNHGEPPAKSQVFLVSRAPARPAG